VLSKVRDVQYWLDRAEEAQLQAEDMTYPDTRRELLKVAAEYRRLARYAEERTNGKRSRG
jgi:hypothetical protein